VKKTRTEGQTTIYKHCILN